MKARRDAMMRKPSKRERDKARRAQVRLERERERKEFEEKAEVRWYVRDSDSTPRLAKARCLVKRGVAWGLHYDWLGHSRDFYRDIVSAERALLRALRSAFAAAVEAEARAAGRASRIAARIRRIAKRGSRSRRDRVQYPVGRWG